MVANGVENLNDNRQERVKNQNGYFRLLLLRQHKFVFRNETFFKLMRLFHSYLGQGYLISSFFFAQPRISAV